MSTGGTSLTFARTLRSGRTRSATSHPGPTRAPRRRDSDDVRGRRRLDRRLTGGARRGRLAHRPADDGQRRGRDARDRPRGPGAVRDDPAVGAGGLGHERIQQGDRDAVRCRRFARERRDRGPRDAAPAGDALPHVAGDRPDDPAATDRAVVGALLVQLGRKISVIHAFGHGFARRYDVQQGTVHAVVAPHVLAYLFDEVDASRRALANGLGVATAGRDDAAIAEDVVSEVAAVRDSSRSPRGSASWTRSTKTISPRSPSTSPTTGRWNRPRRPRRDARSDRGCATRGVVKIVYNWCWMRRGSLINNSAVARAGEAAPAAEPHARGVAGGSSRQRQGWGGTRCGRSAGLWRHSYRSVLYK